AAAAVPPGGLLLTGAPRATPPGEPFRVWNSLVVIDERAGVAGIYDKVHLVPFGEYVPLRGVLPIAKLTHGSTDFSSGGALATLDLPGLPPVGPLICYEAIFPGRVTAADRRPAWLLNVTNDGWFGISAGPHQHLASARLRAIEEGLPMVRAANTGISAVADGHGRVVATLGLGERGVLDAPLPNDLSPTPYARLGDTVPLSVAALLAALSLLTRRRYPRSS
ncbi:MAG: apolipoprotein N-acyltransferase, partial [Alphaproteobacteria bacterium]|nr:apolipoprotein N-acyltransferase [Alphaproteobacteria bacterium]